MPTDQPSGSHEAGSTTVRCQVEKDCKNDIPQTIRISLFFDGTLNNRTNVSLGAKGAPLIGWSKSYTANYYTNIAMLESVYSQDESVDFSISIYIEGIGTEDRKKDDFTGMTLGNNNTGIEAKVDKAINSIIRRTTENLQKGSKIKYIHLDAFGFSRGAAAARNLIFAALERKGRTLIELMGAEGYSVDEVKFEFIGLFDTVASHGFDHSNDTEELHLDYISKARRVVQIAAADEHRKNFRLTNINSAVNGLQIFLPGVHSDIGGGYLPIEKEKSLNLFEVSSDFVTEKQKAFAFKREREYLISSGWYTESEINETEREDSNGSIHTTLEGNRNGISNKYSLIPLQSMAEFAAQSGVFFKEKQLLSKCSIPEDLHKVKLIINTYIDNTSKGRTSCQNDWGDSDDEATSKLMKALRHSYLHFSAYNSLTNSPQYSDDDKITGIRQRIIQNG